MKVIFVRKEEGGDVVRWREGLLFAVGKQHGLVKQFKIATAFILLHIFVSVVVIVLCTRSLPVLNVNTRSKYQRCHGLIRRGC